jgi:hypothetical protein
MSRLVDQEGPASQQPAAQPLGGRQLHPVKSLAGPTSRGDFVRPRAREAAMAKVQNKSQLTTARRKLVELMQRINFGRIEQLQVRGGEPVLDPEPRVIRELKFCGDNNPRPEASRSDCGLRPQHLDLFQNLDQLRDGTVAVLIVKHGIPFQAELPG